MRIWLPVLLLLVSSSAAPARAENFLKEMAKGLIAPQQQDYQTLQATGAVQAGTTSLPAGQYMMTNMTTGQGFYVFITPQGQILAQDPRLIQVQFAQGGAGAYAQQQQPMGYGQQQIQQQQMPQQQQGGGFGGIMRNTLNNYVQNRQPGQ